MLQIITGKFYTECELTEIAKKHVLYSNYSWVDIIKTDVPIITPIENNYSNSTNQYLIEYFYKYPKSSVVPLSFNTILEQVRNLLIFGLKVYFDEEKDSVLKLCRDKPVGGSDNSFPSKFISRFFDSNIRGEYIEIIEFKEFFKKCLGLERKKYNTIQKSISNFINALEVFQNNIDLAYSMLVYSLESLSQTSNEYEPLWKDYDKSSKLDKVFNSLDLSVVENVKEIILEGEQFKLQKRFISFVEDNLEESFFLEEAKNIKNSLKKSDLEHVLKNLYKTRSGYVHVLSSIQSQLKISEIAKGNDTIEWDNLIYLTFDGAIRLTHHVIYNFIMKQFIIEKEEYEQWRNEIGNIIEIKGAIECWISNEEGLKKDNVEYILSNFLQYLQNLIYYKNSKKEIFDFTSMCEKIEILYDNSNSNNRKAMLFIYEVCNNLWTNNLDSYEKFMRGKKEFESFSIYSLLLKCLFPFRKININLEEVDEIISSYSKNKYNQKKLRLPLFFEVSILGLIANQYLLIDNKEKYGEYCQKIIFDLGGYMEYQDYVKERYNGLEELNTDVLLRKVTI